MGEMRSPEWIRWRHRQRRHRQRWHRQGWTTTNFMKGMDGAEVGRKTEVGRMIRGMGGRTGVLGGRTVVLGGARTGRARAITKETLLGGGRLIDESLAVAGAQSLAVAGAQSLADARAVIMVMVISMVILIVVQSTVVEMITHPLCWRSPGSRRKKNDSGMHGRMYERSNACMCH